MARTQIYVYWGLDLMLMDCLVLWRVCGSLEQLPLLYGSVLVFCGRCLCAILMLSGHPAGPVSGDSFQHYAPQRFRMLPQEIALACDLLENHRVSKVGKDLSGHQGQPQPIPNAKHIPQCHISTVLECLQGW